ncbi:sugar nucleotidyltransferase [Legionella antarctica]|uniref:Sugar nucleotidyltransferase n=1 Tax=Legionella antarctica TaxID=2708020 RepID=A0A6F8T4I1_9GAMM|nr:phosphocholine cytidylyltransferase family protein [Legionella antarctica]BCA94932.1 sugar nucleotidyltransferase [Legionella antarctica]
MPKCLVHLCGKSLLQRQIDTLNSCGIENIQIVTGYCSQNIETLGYLTSKNCQYDTINMVYSLFTARDFFNTAEDLIISYGDIVYDKENLLRLIDCSGELAIMNDRGWFDLWSLRMENPLEDAETFIFDDDGYVKSLGQKPVSYTQIEGQYTGLIKVSADKLEEVVEFYNGLNKEIFNDRKDFNNMYMTTFLQLLINEGWKAKSVDVKNRWLEVDSIHDLSMYEALAMEGNLGKYYKIEL